MLAIPSHVDSVKYLLVLLHAFSSHSKSAYKVFRTFTEYAHLMQQDDVLLQKLGLTAEQIASLRKPNWEIIEHELMWAAQNNQWLITFFDGEYPNLLREIYNPPLLLFGKGSRKILEQKQLAIVGSRNPTPSGAQNAYMLAKNLVAEGFVITSGLALGIDAAAHSGTLAAKGQTIAVMGAGFDHIYPRRHKALAQEIVDTGGVLLSEFPLSCAPLAENFPQRNRIISGLSLGVIVVEAAQRSGSLITARLAAEQGRDVFAFPGSIHNQLARGCHELIRQGAKLVEETKDILEELSQPGLENKTEDTNISNIGDMDCVSVESCKLLQAIDDIATPLDVIAARSSLTIKEIMSMLVHLELQGIVQKVAGGYVRTNKNSL